jgi:hypothetical protein
MEDGAGCVCRPYLTWWWRSWVAVAVTAEMTYQVSADQPAVVEAAGKHAAQVGLIGGCAIASFKEIAAGLISRARSTEVFSGRSAGATTAFAGGAGVMGPVVTATVQGVSASCVAMLTLRGSTRSRGGGRRLRRGAGVVILGRSGGRRGDSRRPPACRPGLGRSGDALRIGRRAGDGSGR